MIILIKKTQFSILVLELLWLRMVKIQILWFDQIYFVDFWVYGMY